MSAETLLTLAEHAAARGENDLSTLLTLVDALRDEGHHVVVAESPEGSVCAEDCLACGITDMAVRVTHRLLGGAR